MAAEHASTADERLVDAIARRVVEPLDADEARDRSASAEIRDGQRVPDGLAGSRPLPREPHTGVCPSTRARCHAARRGTAGASAVRRKDRGRRDRRVRSTRHTARARADGSKVTCDRVADMFKPTALTAHLVWCTGVGRTLKGAEAVAIGEAGFRSARLQASESADGAAAEYRRLATPRPVAFDNELERWRAFCELAGRNPARDPSDDRSSHAVAEASVVLVDHATGKRFVRTGWFAGYVKREVGDLHSPAALATRMERVGWTACNSQGRINATTPSNGQRLSWRFYAVPGGGGMPTSTAKLPRVTQTFARAGARGEEGRTSGNPVTGADPAG